MSNKKKDSPIEEPPVFGPAAPKMEVTWQMRVDELIGRLPTIRRGHGLSERPYTIRPREAKTREDFQDAGDLEALLESAPLSPGPILIAVRWARAVFRDDGWIGPKCWVAYSPKSGRWLPYPADFVRRVRLRHSREFYRLLKLGGGAYQRWDDHPPCMAGASRRFLQLSELIADGRYSDVGTEIFYANRIIQTFVSFRSGRRARGRPNFPFEKAFELGRLWGEAQLRFSIEPEALIGIKVRRGASKGGRPTWHDCWASCSAPFRNGGAHRER